MAVQVNELQRRQRKEHEKEVKRREKLQEKEKAEHAAQAKLKMEEEAYQLQVGSQRLVLAVVPPFGMWVTATQDRAIRATHRHEHCLCAVVVVGRCRLCACCLTHMAAGCCSRSQDRGHGGKLEQAEGHLRGRDTRAGG